MDDSFNTLIDDVKRFFRFQSRLSGGVLYVHSEKGEKVTVSNEENISHSTVKLETSVVLESGRQSPLVRTLFDVREEWMSAQSLDSLDERISNCDKCPLGRTRTRFVFGVGNPEADIMLIGEAPGAEEDLQGEPFVGRAGQLLNKILEAVGLQRREVYICNILKCRPPNNRDPQPTEVEHCEPYLQKQIEIIQPKVILALGRVAGQTLLRTTEPLASLRGKVHTYLGFPMIVVYHPAALLRNPNFKRTMWEDMKAFRNYYVELKGSVN